MGNRRNKKKTHHPQQQSQAPAHHRHHSPKKGQGNGHGFMGNHLVSQARNAANPHPNGHAHSPSTRLHARTASENADLGCVVRREGCVVSACAAGHANCQWSEQIAGALRRWVAEMNAVIAEVPERAWKHCKGGEDEGMDWRPENTVWICYVDRAVEEARLRCDTELDLWNGFTTPPCTPENTRFARA